MTPRAPRQPNFRAGNNAAGRTLTAWQTARAAERAFNLSPAGAADRTARAAAAAGSSRLSTAAGFRGYAVGARRYELATRRSLAGTPRQG